MKTSIMAGVHLDLWSLGEKVLQSKLSPNKRGVLHLVKWKGYSDSENSWLPASQMKHTPALVQQFHQKNPSAPQPTNLRVLTAHHYHKEGILSQTYASVHDRPKGNTNLQGIPSSSSSNHKYRLVQNRLPRMTCMKGLDNPPLVMKGLAESRSLLKS
jgi:hypothetical protein